jgi:transposase
MQNDDIEIGIPHRLGHLPLVMDVLRRTGLLNFIDGVIREDPRSKVSTSECVAVLLCGVMVGHHDLWRMADRLDPYDMATIMQDSGFKLSECTEERLAKALDDLYHANLDKLMTHVALETVRQFRLGTDFLHFDTTSLVMWGAYEKEDFAGSLGIGDGSQPVKVTYGYSKDRRGDLKQIMFGSLVSRDGGVPLYGKALDGNRSDSQSAAEFFMKVRSLVRDPSEVCCVADSKGWCAPVLDVITSEGLRLLSRLPRNHRIHHEVMALKTGEIRVVERPPRRMNGEPDRYEIVGVDIEEALTLDESHGEDTRRRTIRVPARAVRVFSTRLWRKKVAGLDGTRAKERKDAAKDIRAWQAEAHACRADAERAAVRHTTNHTYVTLDFTATLRRVEGPLQRGRGRPRKNPEPDLAHDHYRVDYAWHDIPQAHSEERLREAATFVLIRTRSKGWQIDDADLIDRYKGQYHNEHGFAWLKSGAANKGLNPIYLENPHRIEALCFVYLIGLTIWTLIQRTVRAYLVEHDTGLPYHRNKPSARITTRFFFELFPKVQTVPYRTGCGPWQKNLVGIDEVRALACRALGTPLTAFNPVVENWG